MFCTVSESSRLASSRLRRRSMFSSRLACSTEEINDDRAIWPRRDAVEDEVERVVGVGEQVDDAIERLCLLYVLDVAHEQAHDDQRTRQAQKEHIDRDERVCQAELLAAHAVGANARQASIDMFENGLAFLEIARRRRSSLLLSRHRRRHFESSCIGCRMCSFGAVHGDIAVYNGVLLLLPFGSRCGYEYFIAFSSSIGGGDDDIIGGPIQILVALIHSTQLERCRLVFVYDNLERWRTVTLLDRSYSVGVCIVVVVAAFSGPVGEGAVIDSSIVLRVHALVGQEDGANDENGADEHDEAGHECVRKQVDELKVDVDEHLVERVLFGNANRVELGGRGRQRRHLLQGHR